MILVRNRIANIAILTSLVTALILTPGLASTHTSEHAVAPAPSTLSFQLTTPAAPDTTGVSRKRASNSSTDSSGDTAASMSGSAASASSNLNFPSTNTVDTVDTAIQSPTGYTDNPTAPMPPTTAPVPGPTPPVSSPVTVGCGVCGGTQYRPTGTTPHVMCPMYCAE